VTVACTCGDGVLDAANGEQCDQGAANGMPGSCCDAACQVMAAGTVCRAASAACQSAGLCDGASTECPQSVPLSDGTLCDDGDPTTGTSACVGNVCRGVEIEVDVAADTPASQNPVRIPVVIDLGDGLSQATTVQLQGFVSCDDVPALGAGLLPLLQHAVGLADARGHSEQDPVVAAHSVNVLTRRTRCGRGDR